MGYKQDTEGISENKGSVENENNCHTSLEQALDIVGSGRYTVGLVACTGLALSAMALELFGFSLVVTACSCDFSLTRQQQGILSSLPFIGVIMTSCMWGYISDTRGRRLVLMWSLYVSFCLSSLSSLAPNWVVMAVLKFISVCFSCTANVASYTLLGECSPAAVRSRNMLIISIPLMYGLGFAVAIAYPVLQLAFKYELPWVGITFVPWRLLIILLAVPCAVTAISLQWFSESPKFLESCGRTDEALSVLRRMFVINQRAKPENFQVKSIYLKEIQLEKSDNLSLFHSIWEQFSSLFRPPLLCTTLKLFFLQLTCYMTNNSFTMWFPQLFESLFQASESGDTTGLTICNLFNYPSLATVANGTIEYTAAVDCNDKVSLNTAYAISAASIVVVVFGVIVSQLHRRKKTVLTTVMSVSCISSVCVTLVPEYISGAILFTLFVSPCVCMGIISSYFVDLYPTSHRGTAAYIGLIVGRLGGFIGINVVGNVIFTHCSTTFYAWTVLLFGAVVVSFYLPPDKA